LPPAADEAKDLPLELAARLSAELPRLGTREVIITADGEPLLHPHCVDIIAHFRQAGCKVQLVTNGTLIDETAAPRLVDSGLDVLSVSLWAASSSVYAQCYPGTNPAHLHNTIAGMHHVARRKSQLQSAHPAVTVRCVVNRYNWQHLDEIIDLAHEARCDGVAFGPYMDWSGEFADVALSRQQEATLRQELKAIRERLRSLRLSHNIDTEFLPRLNLGRDVAESLPCYAPWFHAAIRCDGTVAPCGACYLQLGNLGEHSFSEIWNGPALRAFRRQGLSLSQPTHGEASCDCTWCCHAHDSHRIHRLWRWFAPLWRRGQPEETEAREQTF
jgi:MoaA/NifB/PqqE/SkfB family radical SAM enzyme